jgi:hypothetical protein
MKKFTLIVFMLISGLILKVNAQETTTDEKITEVNEKVTGLTERLATAESDLSKLTKIKISGYVQGQYQMTQSPLLDAGSNNYFSIRRARVKFVYQATDGIKFVLQPDFSPGALSIKDAYAVLNDHWTKSFGLWIGKFNRPNYEVEYSSSQREVVERSLVIRTLYPNERAIGAKLEYKPAAFPIHVQLALLNGADGLTINDRAGANINPNENKDFDNFKDLMARVTYNVKLGNFGGLDFGAHGYFGNLKAYSTTTLKSDYTTTEAIKFGDPIKRQWFGGEFQLFADVLGGMSIKGEYIAGMNGTTGFTGTTASGTTPAVPGIPNYQNNFAGYYLYFIKNLGKKNQFAFRYDYYDPNTDITGKEIGVLKYTPADPTVMKSVSTGVKDLATSTFDFALHHYFDDNLRITLDYAVVQNEKVGTPGKVVNNVNDAHGNPVVVDWSNAINQNVLTLRIQAKF